MDWEKAKAAISASPEDSSVYVGADSIRYKGADKKFYARYSVVIVLHKSTRNGCQLFHNTIVLPDYGNLKQRLLTEVMYAIDAATAVVEEIGDRPFEIHLDINPNPRHKSNVAMKEALGYVQATFGKPPIFKPASFVATHAADHVVRQ